MIISFILLQFFIASTYAHIFMNDPPSRRNKYSEEYIAQGNVDYNIMAPLYHDGSTFPFPCKGFPKGPSTKTINGNIVDIKLEGTAVHGGGHCQFGVTYDDSTFVVLKTVTDNCLISGMNYNFDLPSNIPSGDITVFWTWVNRIGNREYYMECADITVNNPNGNTSPVEIKGKELLVVNILGKTIIPENLPAGNDGIDLLNARKDISIVSGGSSSAPVVTQSLSSPTSSQTPTQLPSRPSPPPPPPSPQMPSSGQVSTIGTYYFRVGSDQPGCPPVQAFNDGNIYGPCSVQYGAQSKYWVAIKNGGQHCGEKITAYSGSKSIVLTVMDECPGCGSDNHLDMSLEALVELTGSVESACAINTVQPRLTWSFGGNNILPKPNPESKLEPTFINEPTPSRRRTRTRKVFVSTTTSSQLSKPTPASIPISTPSIIDTEYQEYLEFKKYNEIYEKECEENKLK